MKIFLTLFCVTLAGCQNAGPVPLPVPASPPPESRPAAVVPMETAAPLQQKLRQQAQYIDALISQNEALAAKLNGASAPSAPTAPPLSAANSVAAAPLPAPSVPEPAYEALTPNADGVIDLTAAAASAQAAESTNPFAVRSGPTGPAREVALHVSGILAGKTPCAVINDELVQVNETIEALTVERIEADWIGLRYAGQRLRVPVSDQPVKVKLPL